MQDNITGKTILLLGDKFHSYCDKMKETLIDLGAKEVILIEMKQIKGNLRDRIGIGTLLNFMKNPMERKDRTKEIINQIEGLQIDIMFNFSRLDYNKNLLDYLRERNPNIKMFFFHWDRVKTHHPRFFDYYPKFDKVYTFDREDAKIYGFEYFPDFYVEEEQNSCNYKYDIAFIGRWHCGDIRNRARIIYQVDKFCKENNLKSYLYLRYSELGEPTQSQIKLLYKKLKLRKFYREVSYFKQFDFFKEQDLSLGDVDRVFNASKVIIDLNHPNRQGMTINCITALAKGKKLITTNKRIKEEPFYDPNVIYILNEDNPQLDIEFFNSPYTTRVDMSYLRMDNWLKHIINNEDSKPTSKV